MVRRHAAKLYSSKGKNLLRIKSGPQSALLLILLLLCRPSGGVLLITLYL